MSRILRRPLFRGGPVSSYGTGIASGLADGGMPPKRGLVDGPGGYAGKPNFKTGSQIMKEASQAQTLYGNLYPQRARGMGKNTEVNDIWSQLYGGSDFEEGDKPDLPMNYTIPDYLDTTLSEDLIDTAVVDTSTGSDVEENQPDVAEEQIKGVEVNKGEQTIDTNTGKVLDTEESTTISADDIREQAALFDKLLNEGYEKDLKSARIGDASDYALQFFKSTVGEGKDWKEAAGDVAGRALAAPSRTEKVQEGKKKTKQTATVMAINEALASNKSDRELDKMFAKMGLDEAMRERLIKYKSKIDQESITFDARLKDAAKAKGKSGKHLAVLQSAVDGHYGEGKFQGKLPEDQSELVEGGIYVGDGDEQGTYKILYEIDATGTPKVLRKVFG